MVICVLCQQLSPLAWLSDVTTNGIDLLMMEELLNVKFSVDKVGLILMPILALLHEFGFYKAISQF